MKTWAGAKTFRDYLLADAEVLKHLTNREIESAFNLDTHFRQVDATFKKVGIK